MQRGLVGDIIKRFEQRGYTLKGLKMMNVERSLAEAHYADLSSKPFFAGLVDYIVSGPVVAMVSSEAEQAEQTAARLGRRCQLLQPLPKPTLLRHAAASSIHPSTQPPNHHHQVWEGKNAVLTGRKMIGATNPQVRWEEGPRTPRQASALVAPACAQCSSQQQQPATAVAACCAVATAASLLLATASC